jgi:hypothetical protein
VIYKAFRWHWWFDAVSRITCPSGHPFKTVEAWSDSDLVCDHCGKDGREDCGKRIYLAPVMRVGGKLWLYAVEVSAGEMREMEERKLKSVEEVFEFLQSKDRSVA